MAAEAAGEVCMRLERVCGADGLANVKAEENTGNSNEFQLNLLISNQKQDSSAN